MQFSISPAQSVLLPEVNQWHVLIWLFYVQHTRTGHYKRSHKAHLSTIAPFASVTIFLPALKDLFALDLEPYRYSGVNMTAFRLLNMDNPYVASVVQRWSTERQLAPYRPESGLISGVMTVRIHLLFVFGLLNYILFMSIILIYIIRRDLYESYSPRCLRLFL